MRFFILIFLYSISIFAQPLTLQDALTKIKNQNLELKMADYNIRSSALSIKIADAQNYGKLNFIENASRSNDAGNVFGFKLTSREASFSDFGFDEFLSQIGGLPGNSTQLLATQPDKLNYPDARNFFQSKLQYKLPIYTGKKIEAYKNIAQQMHNISILDKTKQLQEKIFQTRKAFYNMGLLEGSLKNLHLILSNIQKLELTTKNMIAEGYAKKIDILEVQSKEANIVRIISELEANKELLYHYLSFLLNENVSKIVPPKDSLAVPQIGTQEVLDRNIDIKKAQTALDIRKNMLVAQESKYLPTLGFMAEVQTADDNFLSDAGTHKSYTLGFQLKWNLYDGGADNAAIEQAKVNQLKSLTQTELAKQGVALKLKEIQTKIKQADSEIKNLSTELLLAQSIYKNYEGRYKEQLISMSEVIVKQSSWLEKVLQLLKAKNSRNLEIFALERLALITGDDK